MEKWHKNCLKVCNKVSLKINQYLIEVSICQLTKQPTLDFDSFVFYLYVENPRSQIGPFFLKECCPREALLKVKVLFRSPDPWIPFHINFTSAKFRLRTLTKTLHGSQTLHIPGLNCHIQFCSQYNQVPPKRESHTAE